MQRGRNGAALTGFDLGYITVHGIFSGLTAGVVFIVFETIVSALQGTGAIAFFEGASAMVLGTGTMSGAYSAATIVVVGLLVHFVIAVFWATVFALLLSVLPTLATNSGVLLLSSLVFGTLVWLIDLYVIAPISFPWFADADPLTQFVAHAFGYGLPLGIYFSAIGLARRRAL